MLSWLKRIFTPKKTTKLLDDHVESAAAEELRAFPSDGTPYRATVQFLERKPVTEEDLLQAERRIQEWLFRRFEIQDCTHVLAMNHIEVLAGAPAVLQVVAQRTMRISRLVLFSPQLDEFQVTSFHVGVEAQGELYQGSVNASLYRILTLAPVQLNTVIQHGMCANVNAKNNARKALTIGGALLGTLIRETPDDSASILARVRDRKRVISLVDNGDEDP